MKYDFQPIFEYSDKNIVLVERGHHLRHILGFVVGYALLTSPDQAIVRYADTISKDRRKTLQIYQSRIEQWNTIEASYKELLQHRWFIPLIIALVQNSFWGESEHYKWDVNEIKI